MSDLYLRAHTEVIAGGASHVERHRKRQRNQRKDRWPREVLVLDTESRTDTNQDLTFGFYRVLELVDDCYQLIEEGAFFADNLTDQERLVLESYIANADHDFKTFPPRFPLHTRDEFIQKVFYKWARRGAMIVGFNLVFDLSRLALEWPKANRGEWSLMLVKNANGSENKFYPRIVITPIDSKKAFIRFWYEWTPERKDGTVTKPTRINEARFLDLRTLLWSLYNKSFSLKRACDNEKGPFKGQNLPQKLEGGASGRVTFEEIEYARQDVRCTAALLNAAKKEFDLHHDVALLPEGAYSPASWAKSYLSAMGINTPAKKFTIPKEILGIAMESYSGGRAETMLRLNEVPVVPVDYTSEYPSVCALLGLFDILTAETLEFPTITEELQQMLVKIAQEPDDCFEPEKWKQFVGFALIQPNDDVILPVRSNYNGITSNIANVFLEHKNPIWQPIPDIVASVIRTKKIPRILKAIRIVPLGKQRGMKSVSLRGMVEIDPYKDDLFQTVIQQRKLNKNNPTLSYWLKIFANSIYGFFVETNLAYTPENKPVRVRVYAGQETYEPKRRYEIEESHGNWYAPYIASLITSGGRLLLGLLEKCVIDAGGVWAWADTDALAIVANERGDPAKIESSEHGELITKMIKALSWAEINAITEKFESLNPYDRKLVPSLRLLNLTDDNYVDPQAKARKQRQLLGMSISSKRYDIYERHGDQITIINPKAHGLGYLYPPVNSPKEWDDDHDAPKWIYDLWLWIVQTVLGLRAVEPEWFNLPQMMRVSVSTENVLSEQCHSWDGFRPFNFFMRPMISPLGVNVDPSQFALAAPMESEPTKWIHSRCINICDSEDKRSYKITTDPMEAVCSPETILISDFRYRASTYIQHPESKALAPDGSPCKGNTRGLLQRPHIVIDRVRRISKECDRRWEDGEDADAIEFEPPNYDQNHEWDLKGYMAAREKLIRKIKRIGIRELIRRGCSEKILSRICRRELVKVSTLLEYERILNVCVYEHR